MINTIFHFVNDPTFDYQTAVNNGDISEYTIVFNSADHSIHCKGTMFGRMSRADMAETLGNISDLIPVATDSTLGGIKIGYTNNSDLNSRRYGVVLDDNNKAYVEVPWTDTITPVFDDTELKNLVAIERGRIDNFISNLSATIDAKNRELYADGDWIREIFGNVQDPGSVAAAYRKEIDEYLQMFDVWEYIDPEHPELGRKSRIVELQNDADGLTHRIGEAETSISGNSVAISTLTHDLSGLTSTVTNISDDLDTVTRKESSLEQTVDSIGLRVTSSEGNISTLQTQEASLQVLADKIQSRVVATENSINGCYQITIVNNPSNAASAVDVSTISTAVAERESLSNHQLINDEDFTTAPTAETLYKNSVPQYFTFSRYKGLTVRATEIEQTADSIALRVGTVEGDRDSLITRTSTLEQTADSLSTRVGAVEDKADGIDTTLSTFEQTVNTEISGIKTAQTNLSSSVSSYETTNDGNIGNLIKMAAAVLDLKSSSDAEGNLSTTTDLANVITNGSFSGYSGLSQRVSLTESGVSANASLIADVQDTIEGLDIDGAVTRATAGFASETWVGLNYDTKGSAATAEANAKGYADNIVAGAKADVIASIDDTVAGMTVLVTKDSSGYIDSNIYLKANQIYLDGLTNFKTAVGAFVKTDVLEAGTATIDAATINSANITGTLNGVNGVFSGSLSAATGSFSGEVSASEFVAGDDINGFSINIIPSAFQFNWKGTPLAWFSLCDWDSTNNTFAAPTSNPKGFYLYMRNPVDGHMITIDFANISNGFKDLNANSNPVYTYPLYSITRLNGNVAYDPVISQDRDVYYTDVNGTKTWYSNSQGTTALNSVSGYRKASVNYGTGPNTGSPMSNPHVLKQLRSSYNYDLVKADIYIGQTLSGGQVVDDTSKIVVVVTDTDGHYKICTPISGNPKSVSGASNVYYQGVLSNSFAGGHRDVGTSSTYVSAYVVDLAPTNGNIYSGNSVTYFDNNGNTTSMLATTYPAAS